VRGQRHAPPTLYPREIHGTHCTGGWVCPRAGMDRCGKSRPPPELNIQTVQAVASRYTDYATRSTSPGGTTKFSVTRLYNPSLGRSFKLVSPDCKTWLSGNLSWHTVVRNFKNYVYSLLAKKDWWIQFCIFALYLSTHRTVWKAWWSVLWVGFIKRSGASWSLIPCGFRLPPRSRLELRPCELFCRK
jgi:hypothetical protein